MATLKMHVNLTYHFPKSVSALTRKSETNYATISEVNCLRNFMVLITLKELCENRVNQPKTSTIICAR